MMVFAALHESGHGTEQPIRNVRFHGRSGGRSGRAKRRESDIHNPLRTFLIRLLLLVFKVAQNLIVSNNRQGRS
jgi:hypothetical protein